MEKKLCLTNVIPKNDRPRHPAKKYIGHPVTLKTDGNKYFILYNNVSIEKATVTTMVDNVEFRADGTQIIETKNTTYVFQEITEDEADLYKKYHSQQGEDEQEQKHMELLKQVLTIIPEDSSLASKIKSYLEDNNG